MTWRSIQKKNFVHLNELCDFLQLDEKKRERLLERPRFTLNVPLRLAQKIAKNTLDDPLLRQFLPLKEELNVAPGFSSDPVRDGDARKGKKLLHKYQGRALLLVSSACAMHCRFCFRQNFDYASQEKSFDEEIALIEADASLKEIILSGGDPLSLSNEALKNLIDRLSAIKHLSLLRFHTRFPIGIPERIDEGFLKILASTRLQVYIVIHCNHPRELDEDVAAHLKKIRTLGIPILNHCVLLRGVNDTVDVQKALNERLVEQGILPYYLHQLDRVQGAAHFEVSQEEGVALIDSLRNLLPGYALPRYVAEIPGRAAKTTLA